MRFEIAVDVGGTFTDLVLRTEDGRFDFFKSSTTPADASVGIFNALELAATRNDLTLQGLLAACTSFACGTTVATNAILEAKSAKTALICTHGFRDTLLIREGGKSDTYNIFLDYPEPYIPRHLTFGVHERVNSEGGVEIELDDTEVRNLIGRLKQHAVEAVAVALLWSIANPDHERRIGALLEQEWPEIPFSLSHQVSPTIREYRRTSAAALDASLKPIVAKWIRNIESRLREHSFNRHLTFITSNGGRTSAEDIVGKPIYLSLSGPSAAPVAGTKLAQLEGLGGNLIVIDMGGTSFDASIITNWQIPMHREGIIDGHILCIPSVDLQTIGAGGGSIARVDAGGLIHVGPSSAGSYPGPACYQRGGLEPTVTDADVILGLLDPNLFAGGTMKLSYRRSEEVIEEKVARPLNVTMREAASLVCLATEQNMIGAIEKISIRRGIDPREYVLVIGGAASGLHAAAIARELGIRRILAPAAASVLSAFGIAVGDIKFNYARSFLTDSSAFAFEPVNEIMRELKDAGTRYLNRMEIESNRRKLNFSVEARYADQVWQLTLPLTCNQITSEEQLTRVVESFHELHERIYSVRSQSDIVEFTEWSLEAVGLASELRSVADVESSEAECALPNRRRPVYVKDEGGEFMMPVIDGGLLKVGKMVSGPVLIETNLTTIMVPSGAEARKTTSGNIIIELSIIQ